VTRVCLSICSGEGVAHDGNLRNERSGDLFETIFTPEHCFSEWLVRFIEWNDMKEVRSYRFIDLERFSEDLDERTPQLWVRFLRFDEGFKEIGKCLDHKAHVGCHQCLEVVQ